MTEVKTTFVNGINPFLALPLPEPPKLVGPGKVVKLTEQPGRGSCTELFNTLKQGDAISCSGGPGKVRTINNLLRRYIRVRELPGFAQRDTKNGFIYWR